MKSFFPLNPLESNKNVAHVWLDYYALMPYYYNYSLSVLHKYEEKPVHKIGVTGGSCMQVCVCDQISPSWFPKLLIGNNYAPNIPIIRLFIISLPRIWRASIWKCRETQFFCIWCFFVRADWNCIYDIPTTYRKYYALMRRRCVWLWE